MRWVLNAYWIVSAVGMLWAYIAGYPSIGAWIAFAVGIPWNIVVSIALAAGIVATSFLLEAIGMARIDLSAVSGNQQAIIAILLGSMIGVPLNSFIAKRFFGRQNDKTSKKSNSGSM